MRVGKSMVIKSVNYPNSKDKNSFESGMEYQDYVADLLRDKLGIVITNYTSAKFQFETGENKQGIEIKLDKDFDSTNQLSIETAEKTKANNPIWVPSGIYRNDNSWLYIQGTFKTTFIFSKNLLIMLHKTKRYVEHTAYGTLKGFFLPMVDCNKYASKIIFAITPEEKLNKWGALSK